MRQGAIVLAVIASSLLASSGCGGGGSGGSALPAGGGGGGGGGGGAITRLSGTASAPSNQLNQSVLSQDLRIKRIRSGHRPIARGTVTVREVSSRQLLGQGQTDDDGQFAIAINISVTTHVEVMVVSAGANAVTVRNIISVSPGNQITMEIDVVTTVAAEAFDEAVEMGLDQDDAVEIEIEIENEVEDEPDEELRTDVDLRGNDEHHSPRDHARRRIAGLANRKIAAFLLNPNARSAKQAIMAGQVFAQVGLGLNERIHLDRNRLRALIDAMVANHLTAADDIASDLAHAGVMTSSGGGITAQDVVNAARRLRSKLPAFGAAGDAGPDTRFTLLEALLLAVQVNDMQVNFSINTQTLFDAYVDALLTA